MRRSIPFLALLLATTAGCSQAVNDGNGADRRARPTTNRQCGRGRDRSQPDPAGAAGAGPATADRGTAPDIDPESAPGIAFDYRYAFRLEADRIAGMQREHQQLCARYGSRCQVTGVDYRAANEEDVEAMLSFLVDPAIAAQFGRESVSAVTAADGELTESAVSGTDVGTSLKANNGELEELQAELDRVEARLARRNVPCGGTGPARGAAPVAPPADFRARRDDGRAGAEAGDDADPVPLRLGGARAGAGAEPTIGEATARAANNFLGALKTLLILFVSISPWVLTGLLLWLGFRAVRKRWPGRPAAPAEAAAGRAERPLAPRKGAKGVGAAASDGTSLGAAPTPPSLCRAGGKFGRLRLRLLRATSARIQSRKAAILGWLRRPSG